MLTAVIIVVGILITGAMVWTTLSVPQDAPRNTGGFNYNPETQQIFFDSHLKLKGNDYIPRKEIKPTPKNETNGETPTETK